MNMSVLRGELQAKEDMKSGAPGAVCIETVKVYNRTNDYSERARLSDWLKDYNETLEWDDYEPAVTFGRSLAEVARRLRIKPDADGTAGGS